MDYFIPTLRKRFILRKQDLFTLHLFIAVSNKKSAKLGELLDANINSSQKLSNIKVYYHHLLGLITFLAV